MVLVYWERPDATIWALLTPDRWLLRATMREIGLSTPLEPCSADGWPFQRQIDTRAAARPVNRPPHRPEAAEASGSKEEDA